MILFLGCAQPNYSNGDNNANNVTSKNYDCELKFTNSSTCLSWKWTTLPEDAKSGEIYFELYWLDSSGLPTFISPLGVVSLVLWMPSMGHGSAPVTVTQIDEGKFLAQSVMFVMPGQWELRFKISDGDTLLDEVIVPYFH